jgi:hypothetical protein
LVDPCRLGEVDTSAVKLTQNPDVWLADVLWAALPAGATDGWIVATLHVAILRGMWRVTFRGDPPDSYKEGDHELSLDF